MNTTDRLTTTIPIQTLPIPQEIQEEIQTFEEEVQRVQDGDVPMEQFKPFRLQYGIYGQRQPDVQMVRIKIPFGGLTSNQLRRIAEVAETCATGVGHVTTRQDIQLHFIPLPQVGAIMRKLAEVGLTTREACGNTVRNVTACHLAGVCRGEVFDVTPYANTVAQHLLRNPLNQSLPRKFKIALSGCNHDCAMTPIHDVGLLAKQAEDGTRGFRMVVGGGLGSAPRIAHLLREFVPVDDLLPSIEALIKVFDSLGNRKNRNKARMKFVVEKLGFEAFRRRWEEAYEELFGTRPSPPPMRLIPYADPAPLILPTKNGSNGQGGDQHDDVASSFATWQRTNVVKQRQQGFVAVIVRLPTGDVTAGQMFALADLAEHYANGNVRTTIGQNVIIRWVPEAQLESVYETLAGTGLGQPGASHTEDIVACPGTDTCGLGITSSKGLARALADVFPPGQVPDDLKGTTIHISGCHNSCAQHHIATIGLHGVGKRIANRVIPVYELHLGGRINGTAEIGVMTIKLPAKHVPAAIAHLVDVYRRDRQAGETLHAFLKRTGKAALKEELLGYSIPPSYEEDPSHYVDWEADEEFTVEDLGPGECAGGAMEMIDNRILEAEQELYQARLLAGKHQFAMATNKAYRAIVAGAKALLVTEGIDPNTDADTLSECDQYASRHRGLIPDRYRDLARKAGDMGTKENVAAFTQEKMTFAKGFVEVCRQLTESIDQDLKIGGTDNGSTDATPATAHHEQASRVAPAVPWSEPLGQSQGQAGAGISHPSVPWSAPGAGIPAKAGIQDEVMETARAPQPTPAVPGSEPPGQSQGQAGAGMPAPPVVIPANAGIQGEDARDTQDVTVLDLRGVMCPLNYVKTKLKLETMEAGAQLEVWLDEGAPIKNVPMSLRNDGHRVLAEEPLEDDATPAKAGIQRGMHFKVLVEKVETDQ